jgi:hypothetical protein
MFVGHYAAALAGKAIEPRAPLWTLVAGAQLVDIAWAGLLMTGAEKVRFDTSLPGSALDLYHMPYTHSLPAAALWAVAALLLSRLLLRLPWRAAGVIGAVVFSHWLLDFLVHRPDLELWFGGAKVGLGWWNYPVAEATLEMGLIALAGGAWLWSRGAWSRSAWPALGFMAFLLALQIVAGFTVPAGSAFAYGRTALIIFLVVTAVSILADRRGKHEPEPI